jgi:DNA processing protein
VFAVPGSALSDNSEGSNWLIQQGAKLTTSLMDVLDELNIEPAATARETDPEAELAIPASANSAPTQGELGVDSLARKNNGMDIEDLVQRHVAIAGAPCHVDEISRSVGGRIAEVTSALTVLALKGVIDEVGPITFVGHRSVQRPAKVRSQKSGRDK